MQGKGMPRADFIMGLILMAFSVFIIRESLRMPTFEKDWGGFYAAPGFVPMIFGGIIFAMSLFLWIRAMRNKGYKTNITREKLRSFLRSKTVHRWCLAIAYAFLFFFLLGRIYFYLAAFLVLFLFMVTFGKEKLLNVLIISFVTSAAIYFVFTRIFLVPLP
jgi:putative tricarboxylic transport membrane protein